MKNLITVFFLFALVFNSKAQRVSSGEFYEDGLKRASDSK